MAEFKVKASEFIMYDTDFNGKLDAQEAKNAREDGCIWAQEGQDKEAFNKARLEHISELLSTPEMQEKLRKTDEKFRQLLKESKEKEENQQEQETKKSEHKIADAILYAIMPPLKKSEHKIADAILYALMPPLINIKIVGDWIRNKQN